jgi:DNA-binding NtrC family response regulator
VFTIELAPLRNRLEDIPMLVDYYIKKYSDDMDVAIKKVNPKVIDLLTKYRWPGNIRELSNALRSAVVLADDKIEIEHLPTSIRFFEEKTKGAGPAPSSDPTLKSVLKKVEREHILETLKKTDWNRAETAKILEIDSKTLYNKMKEYDIVEP